ncbi:conserved Plasmodium protein, unknown function [Plasmodium berghei]|uniref:Transmembrane protein n=2 Tax=Plasmodium berghei TaxID=5821 RepID=A0A509AK80_PLABA|nr:conserved Plasmodium protein, unknown function [Plasmodium berghei ANKA]CXI46519.1 conserved Plasmodium protein, unknown function [Plasmodium berghei]SCM22792.1 conserved Plasmodium protein, unknown function [Plasmodium berghei]SCN25695.1 conserved Plasmodium protein, unknown function [Plasmodium berghei]SCO60615.1 conserved Plasmodium protein, unknown function [Plasmodium berghei]SCO62345.1 conserved Plasmodium protein, unknown function [Plasmodium berghei]|eukprot:XP_034421762.1 conserved Plasmodium protein, unknown function [Plasmodium berghei ANKA]
MYNINVDKRTLVLIFGLVGSILGFIIGILFNSANYTMGCYISITTAIVIYTIVVYIYHKNSRDFIFSYGVSTIWMFVIYLLANIIATNMYTSYICRYHMNGCGLFVTYSIFGFISTFCFLAASYLSFKIAYAW